MRVGGTTCLCVVSLSAALSTSLTVAADGSSSLSEPNTSQGFDAIDFLVSLTSCRRSGLRGRVWLKARFLGVSSARPPGFGGLLTDASFSCFHDVLTTLAVVSAPVWKQTGVSVFQCSGAGHVLGSTCITNDVSKHTTD